jgi:dipeptidyl aminopeptidase/acylaminoacyl peptidase
MRLLFCLALFCGSLVRGAAPPDVLANVYERLDVLTASLSPDGRTMVYVKRSPSAVHAVVLDVDAAAVKKSLELAKDTSIGGARVRWLNAHRFLVQFGVRDLVALDDDGTHVTWIVDWKKPHWKRERYGPDTFDYVKLDPPGYISSLNSDLRRSPRLVALPHQEPEYAYVEGVAGGILFREQEDHALFKIHLSTGTVQLVETEKVTGAIIHDQQGRPRILREAASMPQRLLYRAADAAPGKWQPLEQVVSPPDGPLFTWSGEKFFGPRAIPIGFDEDPNVLYIASNAGRDTYGIYAIDLRTGRRTSLAIEDPVCDLIDPLTPPRETGLVFDRQKLVGVRYVGLQHTARWVDEELRAVQQRVAELAPRDIPSIEQWDTARERFLVHLSSRGEAGAYAMYFREQDKLQRFFSRSSAPSATARLRSAPWAFKRDTGESLSGSLTLPPTATGKPPCIVVCFSGPEWNRASSNGGTDITALAHMGFAVIEVNPRGVAGFGMKHWQAGRHHFDAMAAEDALLAVDRIAREARLDGGRFAVFGNGFGGLLALRAAALHPERIACVATVSPTLDMVELRTYSSWFSHNKPLRDSVEKWFFGDTDAQRREHSPRHLKAPVKQPVFVAARVNLGYSPDEALAEFRSRQKRAKNEVQFAALPDDFDAPTRYREAFIAMEKFLAKHLGAEAAVGSR